MTVLSLTDQAIAMGNGKVSTDVVNTMLGLLDEDQPIEIITPYIKVTVRV